MKDHRFITTAIPEQEGCSICGDTRESHDGEIRSSTKAQTVSQPLRKMISVPHIEGSTTKFYVEGKHYFNHDNDKFIFIKTAPNGDKLWQSESDSSRWFVLVAPGFTGMYEFRE
jgi:hypothetical protein